MEIYTKKYTAKPRFSPHFNTATGRYYGTVKEYVADLKSKGLEPVKHLSDKAPEVKKRGPSKWSRGMVEAIRDGKQADGTVKVGDRFRDELHKRGVSLPGERKQ